MDERLADIPGVRTQVLSGIAVTVGLSLTLGLWLAFADIRGAVIVRAHLETLAKTRTVSSPVNGRVNVVHVKDNQVIRAGDLVVTLDSADLNGALNDVSLRIFELSVKRARLLAERDDLPELKGPLPSPPDHAGMPLSDVVKEQERLLSQNRAMVNMLRQEHSLQQANAQHNLDGLNIRLGTVIVQIRLLEAQLGEQNKLGAQGLVPPADLRRHELELANAKGLAASLDAEIASLRATRAALDVAFAKELLSIERANTRELADIGEKLNELLAQRSGLQRRLKDYALTAPVDGIVLSIDALAAGAVVRAQDTLVTIVPTGHNYRVTARVSSADIGKIAAGQSVRIRLPTIPDRRSDDLEAHVAHIPVTSIRDKASTSEIFEINLEIDVPENEKAGLVDGMIVDAIFVTASQPAWRYVLAPLLRHIDGTFRQG